MLPVHYPQRSLEEPQPLQEPGRPSILVFRMEGISRMWNFQFLELRQTGMSWSPSQKQQNWYVVISKFMIKTEPASLALDYMNWNTLTFRCRNVRHQSITNAKRRERQRVCWRGGGNRACCLLAPQPFPGNFHLSPWLCFRCSSVCFPLKPWRIPFCSNEAAEFKTMN